MTGFDCLVVIAAASVVASLVAKFAAMLVAQLEAGGCSKLSVDSCFTAPSLWDGCSLTGSVCLDLLKISLFPVAVMTERDYLFAFEITRKWPSSYRLPCRS